MKSVGVLILIFIGFSHCSPTPKQRPLVGIYDLQGSDYSGKVIFKGTISLTSFENSEVHGICRVVKVEQAFKGAVEKNGACKGEISGDKIELYLSPMMSDSGVVFEGHWDEKRITGSWGIERMQGTQTFGPFEAVKH